VKGDILVKVVESMDSNRRRHRMLVAWFLPLTYHACACFLGRYLQHHRGTEPPLLQKPLRSKVMKGSCALTRLSALYSYLFCVIPLAHALLRPVCVLVCAEICKDLWDAEFIDKIGEDRQTLYDLILVRTATKRPAQR
jgi:hypothetical protein